MNNFDDAIEKNKDEHKACRREMLRLKYNYAQSVIKYKIKIKRIIKRWKTIDCCCDDERCTMCKRYNSLIHELGLEEI